jgi:hypothetical protein
MVAFVALPKYPASHILHVDPEVPGTHGPHIPLVVLLKHSALKLHPQSTVQFGPVQPILHWHCSGETQIPLLQPLLQAGTHGFRAVPALVVVDVLYPALHLHTNDPGVLIQVELPMQLSRCRAHSSRSGQLAYVKFPTDV